LLVLDKMAERVTDGPRPTDQLLHASRAAEARQAAGMILGETLIVPANRPANLNMIAVDATGRVMCRRDAAGDPVLQPALFTQASRHRPNAAPCLTFELHQVQLGDTAFGPQVGR